MRLHIEKDWFVDEDGRRILLRGVNFTASSKIPVKPDGSTHIKNRFQRS